MSFQFDKVINRRTIDRINKWSWYPEDVLPMWVSDMDFLTPRPVIRAIQAALKHGILAYELAGRRLLETVATRMERLYAWKISPEMIVPLPGIGAGMSVFVRIASTPGEGILVQPPIYPPFIQGVSLQIGRAHV